MPLRDQVARRSPLRRWTRRIFGMLATAAVLASGAVSASMILSPAKDEVAARTAPRGGERDVARERRDRVAKVNARTNAKVASGAAKRRRAELRAAVETVRDQGYEPVELDDYRAQQVLRVLIGRPREGMPAGLRAFFFVRGRSIGFDSLTPSLKLRPGRQLEREITLVYTLFVPGDRACCPTGGDTRVHFRWTGEKLEPREEIPLESARMPAGLY